MTYTHKHAGQRSTEWVKRLPEVVSALNNEVTRLIGKKPAEAIKEKSVYSKPATPYSRPVGVNDDKALEAYQAAYAKYQKDRTQLLDWIVEQDREKNKAIHDFKDTDQALALFNQTHRAKVALPQEPKFSDYYLVNSKRMANYCSSGRYIAISRGW